MASQALPREDHVTVVQKRNATKELHRMPVAVNKFAHSASLVTISDGRLILYERQGPGDLKGHSSNEMSSHPDVTEDGNIEEVEVIRQWVVVADSSKTDVVAIGQNKDVEAVNVFNRPISVPVNVIPADEWGSKKQTENLAAYTYVELRRKKSARPEVWKTQLRTYFPSKEVTKEEFDQSHMQHIKTHPYKLRTENCQTLTHFHDQILGIKSPAPRFTGAQYVDGVMAKARIISSSFGIGKSKAQPRPVSEDQFREYQFLFYPSPSHSVEQFLEEINFGMSTMQPSMRIPKPRFGIDEPPCLTKSQWKERIFGPATSSVPFQSPLNLDSGVAAEGPPQDQIDSENSHASPYAIRNGPKYKSTPTLQVPPPSRSQVYSNDRVRVVRDRRGTRLETAINIDKIANVAKVAGLGATAGLGVSTMSVGSIVVGAGVSASGAPTITIALACTNPLLAVGCIAVSIGYIVGSAIAEHRSLQKERERRQA